MRAGVLRAGKRIAAALLLIFALFVGPPAGAGNGARGARLAQQWCANCHVVDGKGGATIAQGPPSFTAIARSGITAAQLRVFLSHPHGAMPDLSLSRDEIDDLVAYISTFR